MQQSFARTMLSLIALAFLPGALVAQQGASPGGRPGQGPPTAISGQVRSVDSDATLSAASVAIYSARDSALVTGALTDDAGRFMVPGVMPGGYYARVSYIGYETLIVDSIRITPAAPRLDLGVLRMAVSAVQIEGLTVETERAAVQLAVDRTIYNAQQMPAAAGGNATDVLRNVPAVEVDIDNNVSLRGNSNVAIQINGRPAPMRGEALKNFLQQLPAAMVERVEVIANPSARHDPEGMGGIINIVLQQNADLGLSAGINAGVGSGGRYNASGNVGWQSGPLTLTGNYGFRADEREQDGFSFRTNLYPDTITFFDQDIGGERSMGGHNANLAGEWKFDERNSINSSLGLNAFGFESDGRNAYADFRCADAAADPCPDAERVLTREYDVLSAQEFSNRGLDAVLGYRHTVEPQSNEILSELRYNFSREDTPNEVERNPGVGDTREHRLQDVDSHQDESEYVATLDVIRPLTSTLKLETGYKGTLRRLDSEYESNIFLGDPLALQVDSTTVNDFLHDEAVHAVYGVLSQDLGRFDAQAGLRIERTDTDFELRGDTADTFENGYTSLFPSASLLYDVSGDGMQSLRASYSRRIRRPNERFLNPFPFIEDESSIFRGNPELGPEYTDAFELTWARTAQWGTLQLTPFYRRQTDIIRRFIDTSDPGTRVTSFINADESDQYGADATTSLRTGPFNGFLSLSAYQQSTDASNVEAGLGSETFTWNARLSLGYKLTESTSLQYFHFYRGAQELEQGRISAFEFSNAAIRQELFENATLTLRVMDPFDRMGFSFHTEDENQIQDTERSWGARAVFLQFSYSWGQQPRIRQARPEDTQGQQPDADVGIQ
ncbi:MAG TPA: TonB-dependent receptor [Longimicrobiales bacterium]|nr:TonB-dependent receptor [Longimicrobiales bacterium]